MARKEKRVEGGCRGDKSEGRKEEGSSAGGKGQEEDEDYPRAVENNRLISEIERHQRSPKALASFLGAAERPELAQGHTTNLEVMLEPTLRPHDPQSLIWLIGSRLG